MRRNRQGGREGKKAEEMWGLHWSDHGFTGGSVVKNPTANEGDAGSISGSGRSPGVGNGNLPQYSCLGNPMDRGDWQDTLSGRIPWPL